MAKKARAGDLRTKITVTNQISETTDLDGYSVSEEARVSMCCKWVNAYGKEVYDAKQAGVIEPATLTLRYTQKITPTSLILKEKDPSPYEVISINNVEERCAWLEVKVQRKSQSK